MFIVLNIPIRQIGKKFIACIFCAAFGGNNINQPAAAVIKPVCKLLQLAVKAVKTDGSEINFTVISRLDTEVDVEYFENGGILPCVIRKMIAQDTD